MKLSVGKLVTGTVWAAGAFGASQALRVVTNIILTRLLAPELFGLMVIVNTLRLGIQLISDLGIPQNIIYSKNSYEPKFYNTAWTLQIIRSIVLWIIFMAAAMPVARIYGAQILAWLLPISAIGIVFGGFTSVVPSLLQKRMEFAAFNLYYIVTAFIGSVVLIILAYVNPTIWALVYGGLIGSVVTTIASFFLTPRLKHELYIDKRYAIEIVGYGKWIFASSIVFFFAGNIDRLYFGKVVPLALLGIYGIARNISDLFSAVSGQIGSGVVFPFIASHAGTPRETLHRELKPIRMKFLLLMAIGCSLIVSTADFAIKLLYDARYHAATWMLPILVIGSWFSMIAALNESTILGLGRPSYTALANGVRLILLLVALPLSFAIAGLSGSVIALALVEACRCIPLYVGQRRERFSFGGQDVSVTIMMFMLTGALEWARWASGFGTSFDSLLNSFSK
jgi:O-antigen/teichoic acid export membrane protein